MSKSKAYHARTKAGVSIPELSRLTGLSTTLISRVENKQRNLTLHNAVKIARALGVSLPNVWEGEEVDAPGVVAVRLDHKVSVLGKVAAGLWMECDDGSAPKEPLFHLDIPNAPGVPEGYLFGLLVEGRSINKIANDGDILMCLDLAMSGVVIRDGDLVIVERIRNQGGLREFTAKRIRRYADRLELWPESTDPRWQEPFIINKAEPDGDTEIRVIARVEWVYRPVTRA